MADKRDIEFENKVIIQKHIVKNIYFNHKVNAEFSYTYDFGENYYRYEHFYRSLTSADIIVCTDNNIKRLTKLDNGIINPKNFIFRKKIDYRTHIIYVMDKSYYNNTLEFRINYEDGKNRTNYLLINVKYSFSISNGIRLLPLLSDNLYHSVSYNCILYNSLGNKINNIIESTIRSNVYMKLNEYGPNKTKEIMSSYEIELQDKINEEILWLYGLKIANLNISI